MAPKEKLWDAPAKKKCTLTRQSSPYYPHSWQTRTHDRHTHNRANKRARYNTKQQQQTLAGSQSVGGCDPSSIPLPGTAPARPPAPSPFLNGLSSLASTLFRREVDPNELGGDPDLADGDESPRVPTSTASAEKPLLPSPLPSPQSSAFSGDGCAREAVSDAAAPTPPPAPACPLPPNRVDRATPPVTLTTGTIPAEPRVRSVLRAERDAFGDRDVTSDEFVVGNAPAGPRARSVLRAERAAFGDGAVTSDPSDALHPLPLPLPCPLPLPRPLLPLP